MSREKNLPLKTGKEAIYNKKDTVGFIIDTALKRNYLDVKDNFMQIPKGWKGGEVKTAAEAFEIAQTLRFYDDMEFVNPFHINLVNDERWILYYSPEKEGVIIFGGDAYIEIRKSDGTILKYILGE